MRRLIYYISMGIVILSTALVEAQNPFTTLSSQTNEWIDPSYYLLTERATSMGVVYQSQYYHQQLSKFNTYGFFGQYTGNITDQDKFGFQLVGFQDEDVNSTRSIQMNVGGGYQKQLSHPRNEWQHVIGTGFQIGIHRLAIQEEALWFTNQFDVENEVVQSQWNSGEPVNPGGYISNISIPMHFSIHYQVGYQDLTISSLLRIQNLNQPAYHIEDYQSNLQRGFFSQIDISFPLFTGIRNRLWSSYGWQDLSKIFQVGNGIVITDPYREDWSIFTGIFGSWTPLGDQFPISQFGAAFDLYWNEFGLQFRYLFPTKQAYHLGNTLQLGVFFIPQWDE